MQDRPIPQAALVAAITEAEAARRAAAGQANETRLPTSRPVADIIAANTLTPFNAILGALFAVQIWFGSPADALFGLLLVINTAIGIIQELRAKAALDRLALLTAPQAVVVRDAAAREVGSADVVLGDVVMLAAGDQIVADGTVLSSEHLEVDESLLTGESAVVAKSEGDRLLSGSFASSGAATFVTTAVGPNSYAQRLAQEGRTFARVHSDLQTGINRILRAMALIIVPVGALVVWTQLRAAQSTSAAVTSMVAALVGMIPEGLVLLTTLAFAVGALRLAQRNCLVQELPAVEGLARVDVICTDKTGTLTEPQPGFSRVESVSHESDAANAAGPAHSAEHEATEALAALVRALPARNATADAIAAALPEPAGWESVASTPFSSARKWSAVQFARRGTWVLGAPEMMTGTLTAADTESLGQRIARLAEQRARVLLLARTDESLTPGSESLPGRLTAVALVILEERLRSDAADTVAYFVRQGVEIKVISGDSPATVAAVARAAGVPGAEDDAVVVDARTLPTGSSFDAAAVAGKVFGRVSPEQKREMVEALQRAGRTVAMTGDGVNDVLALKRADVGIAMGSGSPATKAVAQLVLLDSRFASLPPAVSEGRRVAANTERVANLFISKTVWATVLAIATSLVAIAYPFLPRHLTLVSSLSIGIPAFFLALAPNERLYRPGFLGRVTRFALPAGLFEAAGVFAAFVGARALGATHEEAQTLATMVLTVSGLAVIAAFERPVRGWRLGLLASMAGALVLILAIPFTRDFFALAPIASIPLPALGLGALLGIGEWYAVGLGRQRTGQA